MRLVDYSDEQEILCMCRKCLKNTQTVYLSGNAFSKRIRTCLLDEESLIADNSHSAQPPDFYSDKYSMMFDVLRVNDSEIRKSYNPVLMRERNRYNELSKKFGDRFTDDAPMFIQVDSVDDKHTYKNYVRQSSRVIGSHIKKLPLWEQKCPTIKNKGLFVFDDTEVYFSGWSMPSGKSELGHEWLRVFLGKEPIVHMPWLDRSFIAQIYESEIDFVVWFCPCKPYSDISLRYGVKFPSVAIIDTRFFFDKYVDYPDNLVS